MARTSWFDDKAEHPVIQEQVTTVLVELTAYNVMRLLHELQAARKAFGHA